MAEMKRKYVVSATLGLVVVATMLLAGCSTQSPVAPTIEPVPESSQPQLLTRSSAASGAALSPVNLYAEAVIPAVNGGCLELADVVLDIPPGALDNDTLYSITIPDINVFYNEFGTDGLVFKTPVTVTMSYRDADLTGVDESTIRIGWWNDDRSQWVAMDCRLDRVNKVVVGQLYHFSAYALVSD